MLGEQWPLAVVIGAFAVNAVLAYQAYRLGRRYGPVETPAGVDESVDADRDVVECPDCGTENESGYRS